MSVVPASSTWAMLGWSISARACRSASKRAITWRVSMPGLMIFRATLRRTGCGLLGHEDGAHAAFADLLQQLVGADQACRGFSVTGWSRVAATHDGTPVEKGSSSLVRVKQHFDLAAQVGVVAASLAKKRIPGVRSVFVDRGEEDGFDSAWDQRS